VLGRRLSVVVVVVAVLLAACGGSDDDSGTEASHTEESTIPAVTKTELTLVDTSRTTQADAKRNLPEKPDRTLPVMVLAPESDTPLPLVVFAHGHSRMGAEYEDLLTDWAEQGYVVAAPTFPLSSGPEATPDDTTSYIDVFNQPADISFVVRELTERLGDQIDPDAIGVVGHSLGAITALGLRNRTCCTDPAITAVVAVSGMELPFPGDPVTTGAAPLLLIHGGTDPTVAVTGSEGVFANAAPPVSFLRFDEGGHDEVLDGDGEQAATARRAILAFLAEHLQRDAAAWPTFVDDLGDDSGATLDERLQPNQ
jgi:dienelactone hydrolase